MAQALSQWAKEMQIEMDKWLAEPDEHRKEQMKEAWRRKLMEHCTPARVKAGERER